MGVFSKLAYSLGQPTLHATCYETIHTWNPNCYGAVWDAVPVGVIVSLKTYASFYLITNIIAKRGRLDKVNWKKYVKDVLQSTLFLITNMCFFLMHLCKFRHWLGFFTPFTMGFLSSITASALGILMEKKSRRPALALYLTNLASETYYRHLANHGHVKMYTYGECVPFGIGLMLFTWLQTAGRLPKSFNGFMNAALKSNVTENVINTEKLPKNFGAFLEKLRTDYEKTELCHHPHSCVSHSVESFAKNMSMGLMVSSVLSVARNIKTIISNPLKLFTILLSTDNFKLPLFAGCLPLIFNASQCSLNRVKQIPPTVSSVFSAGLASVAMAFYPSVSIAMYCLWKGIETVYFDLVDRGYLPKVKNGEIILYSISAGYVLWNTIVEPAALRRGYLNFLYTLVGGKIALFNRRLYDHFGFVSRNIYTTDPTFNSKFAMINPMLYQPLVK
uniref:TMEM135_C_rich domain-containing protein n=1 Tax=Caenorhabditis japonica TaxID=281687 RepID=A0A8R1DIQ9_CAEJA